MEDPQENELFSACKRLVCEWAGKLLYCVCVSDSECIHVRVYMSIRIASLQTEDLQDNELFSACKRLVCEWAGQAVVLCLCV